MRSVYFFGLCLALLTNVAFAQETNCKNATQSPTAISATRLGIFYMDPARNTADSWSTMMGLTGNVLNTILNSTPELRRASSEARERLLSAENITAATSKANEIVQCHNPIISSTRIGMSQDMSTLLFMSEIRPANQPSAKAIFLIHQSRSHEVSSRTQAEIDQAIAVIESKKDTLSRSGYKKALNLAMSPQRDWPEIYTLHADYWLANENAAFKIAIDEALKRISQMAELLDENGAISEAEIENQGGLYSINVRPGSRIVGKYSSDPDYYLSWNTFIN